MILGRSLEGLDKPYEPDVQFTDRGSSDFSITVKAEVQGEIVDECEVINDEVSEIIDDERSDLADEHIPPEKPENQDLHSTTPIRITESKLSVDPLSTESLDDTLVIDRKLLETSTTRMRKRRPKISLQDKIMQSKLELIEIMKENARTEGKIKEQQLEQEKIKTEMLQRELERSKSCP